MNLIQLLQTCFRSILRNRMRSLLTSLGVIIGVGSVIIMVALGEGSQRAIEARITAMGTNLLQVQPRRSMSRSGQRVMMRMSSFTKKDVEKLKNESSYAAAISGLVLTNQMVAGPQGSAQVSINGVEPDFFIIRNWNVDDGIIFNDEDLLDRNAVAVLGRTTAASLFGYAEDAINRQIRIETNYFTVIGLLEAKGQE
jgi:putative ABC transport system permease protein